MLKLSIIIPVYNTEKYIKRCLESVCNQDLNKSDYEVIVINDGSPDNSKSIILKQQKIYKNIIYFEQENKGLGAARNAGIRLAQGKYLMFIDSDDFIIPYCLRLLYDTISASDAKLLHGDVLCLEENEKIALDKLEIKIPTVEKSIGKDFILQNFDKKWII